MSNTQKSTAQMKQESVDRFNSWVADRKSDGDWQNYIRCDRLNRSEISTECGFARSAFSSNNLLKAALETVEKELAATGVLATTSTESHDHQDVRTPAGPDPRDQEINRLRERVSALAAENAELKAQLRSRNTILDEIIPRGRRVSIGNGQ